MGSLTIKIFGVLAEKLPSSNFQFPYYPSTDELLLRLRDEYPALDSLDFSIAVNKELVQENRTLKGSEEIALLPPFSGG